MSGREATLLVARREITERVREKAFAVSTAINIVIIVGVVIIAAVTSGGEERYVVGHSGATEAAVVESAAAAGRAADVTIDGREVSAGEADALLEDGAVDAVVVDGQIRAEEEPDDQLVVLLQGANRDVQAAATLEQAGVSDQEAQRALAPPPLEISTIEPADDDGKAGIAFFAILILYGQLLTYGYWVAAGVVEEKASRVVEVVLSTIRPSNLLAGKVIGIGVLGLGNLLLTVGIGLGVAQVAGAIEVDGELISAAALALAWFVVGYAFYACAFACAGALVPRQEELQSTITPLSVTILIAFFAGFAVLNDPDGTIAHVTAFIPITAPITMPPRIVTGDAPTWEIAASLAVTIGASIALIPIAGRIYSGGILRTGSSLKLREAWRASRA